MGPRTSLGKHSSICLLSFLLLTLFGTAAIDNNLTASALTPGVITTVAGNGSKGYSGDGWPATSAKLNDPCGVAVDVSGNLYIADSGNDCVRKVNTAGIITNMVGSDNGPATSSVLSSPMGVVLDASGNLYIADTQHDCVRKVSASGIITTVAGDGTYASMYTGEGGLATKATIFPESVAVDIYGNIYIADTPDNRICMVDKSGIITTVAGGGSQAYTWYSGPAIDATLNKPTCVAVDASGNLYIADSLNNCIRKVNTSGIMTTVAGNGSKGYSGSWGPAVRAMLSYPTGVAVDASGNLYIVDAGNYRIRKVDTFGTITTVAGNGIQNYCGDGGPAVSAELSFPTGVAVDASGNLYIADANTIREVTAPIQSSPAAGSQQTEIIFTVGQPSYNVGGQSSTMDASPFISNGRVLVPVRYLADALGAKISWVAPGQNVIDITSGFTIVVITIGSTTIEVTSGGGSNIATSSKSSQMDVAPVIKNSRAYLSARYLAEALDFNISWNAATQTIALSKRQPT